MISAGEFRNGITVEIEGNVFQIIEFMHVKPGKGAAFVRAKLKNITVNTKRLTSENIGDSAFKGVYKKVVVRCPKGMAKKYRKLFLKKGMAKTAVFK